MGPFRLLGRLGQGGQGVVYLGVDARGQRVAVKVLKIEIRDDVKAQARFVREIAAASQVAPFCTARILAYDIEGAQPFVASEYIVGPTLEQRVTQGGPIAGADLDRLAIGTAAALAAIHGANVVHCDLKPANVILGPDWPRVIDFGIARAIDGVGTQTIMGSPAYMAPERYRNADVGPPADIFSWAAMIAFAAAGRAPFGHDATFAIMRRVLDQPPDLAGLSAGLEEMLRACLHKDPVARPVATSVLLLLVAKSGLTLGPDARRSIGELTTRVITVPKPRDPKPRDPDEPPWVVPRQRRGEPAASPAASPAAQRAESPAAQRAESPAAQRAESPAKAPAGHAPVGAEVEAGVEPTVRLSGGRGETRKILPRPDRTKRLSAPAGSTDSETAPTAASAVTWPARVSRAGRDLRGVAFGAGLGGCGAAVAFPVTQSVPVTVSAGAAGLLLGYAAWVLVAARNR